MLKNSQVGIWGLFSFDAFSRKALVSCERNLFVFFQKIFVNSFEIVIQPVLYFLAFGFGLEKWVSNLDNMSYPKYVFLGVICATAMSTAVFESSQALYEKYFESKHFRLINSFPVSFSEALLGENIWSILRSLLACSLFLMVGSSFDLIYSVDFLPILLVCLWLATVFSSLGIWIAAISKSYYRVFYLASFWVIPLFLFSGVFFPIDRIPNFLAIVLKFLPLHLAIDWLRTDSFLDSLWLNIFLVLIYLMGAFFLFNYSVSKLSDRISKEIERA